MESKNINNIKEFSEKIENINVKDIVDIFFSTDSKAIISKEDKLYINYQSDKAKELGLSEDFCKKFYATKNFVSLIIKYNEEIIPNFYKTIEIDNSKGVKEIHHIFRFKYLENLINEKQLENPFIDDGQKILNYSELESTFNRNIDKFKIIDINKIDYETIFNTKKIIQIEEVTGLSYSENFNYYFKYPNKNEKFQYNYDPIRSKLIEMGKTEKIKYLCGNFGIGKSTTLLASKLVDPQIIYINIKALFANKLNIFIWKYELLLKEVAFSLKYTSNLKTFNLLKNDLEKIIFIWSAIIKIVEFTIKKKIKAKIILDQYKEKYDNKNKNIKRIIKLINNDKNNNVCIIISSSINNKDVRQSLIKTWFPEYDLEIPFLSNYIYYDFLFNSKLIVEKDDTLSEKKRNYINNFFNNIPQFYYDIKNIKDDDLEEYKNFQQKKIFDKIASFYQEDLDQKFLYDYYEILLNYRQKIGKVLESDELFKLVKILPLKYFTLKNNIINFYFPLVKTAFDLYLEDKISRFIRSPLSSFKDGFIGDMLEFLLLNDLKNNIFDKFNEVITVETIWDLKLGKEFNDINLAKKDVLILQSESKAKYLDFAILSNSNILILFQCKKALSKLPEDYITKTIINDNKEIIYDSFKRNFNVEIKKIYLLYVTGVSFEYDEKSKTQILKPWGNKEGESFKINEKICKQSDCMLIYYDPIKKKFYIKIDKNEDSSNTINSLIIFAKGLNEINVDCSDDVNEDNNKFDKIFNQYYLDSHSIHQDKLNKIEKINETDEKDKNFFETSDYSLLINKKIPVNFETIGILQRPNFEDFFGLNICVGYKRKGSKIFTYEEKGKKRKIYEIKNSLIEEKTYNDLLNKKEIGYDKFYYMTLKNK